MEDKKNNIDFNLIGEQIELSRIKMKKIGECYTKSMDDFREIGENIQKALEPISIKFELIITEISETISKFDFKKLNNNQKELAKRMIENGWYFSLLLPFAIGELLEMNEEDLNFSLSVFFEEEIDRIYDRVIKMFPNRKVILEKCFKAHKNEDYELSIPVMFAQADGISKEILKIGLFKKKRDKPVTSKQEIISFNEESFIDIPYLLQLSTVGQLNKNCTNPKFLNRHTVLHGIDIKYATKTNSFRCISMLNFLAELKENYIIKKK